MEQPVPLLLDRLQGVRRSGQGWSARCPAHEDRHASLWVASGWDGRALLTCHAGCATATVVSAVGLEMANLYPHSNGAVGPARPATGQGQRRETRYRVQLADGSLAVERIEHVRLNFPDGSKRMWWERNGRKDLGGLSPSSFALYGKERVTDSRTEDSVVVTEGEKSADALRTIGALAVGTVTGAAAVPCRGALQLLADRHVVLWPDADEAGLAHMGRIAVGLESIAASVSWVTPPEGVATGWDAADASPEQARRLIGEAKAVPADQVEIAPSGVILPPPSAPMAVARKIVADRFTDANGTTLVRVWRGGFCLGGAVALHLGRGRHHQQRRLPSAFAFHGRP